MRSFSTKLIAALVMGSLGLATSASAGNHNGLAIGLATVKAFNGGGNGGNGQNCHNGGNNNGGNCHNNGNCNNNNNGSCNNGGYGNNGQAYEPFHSTYVCLPGDNFYTVSLKEYGTSDAMRFIASYNRLASNSALVPGQRLFLPSISANGQMTASRAPAADMYGSSPYGSSPYATATSPYTMPAANLAAPATTPIAAPATTASEPERVSVPTGSTLKLEGEKLGSEAGVVRLRISGVAMPVEVVEWSADSTKVRLPKLDVTDATKAELEVVRADGTVASTNAISLTSAAGSVAAN
jgi:hypothetical protein